MGAGLRSTVGILFVVVLSITALSAQAESFSACWVTSETNLFTGERDQVTRCRISGGSIVDYASDSAVPSQLYAQTGTDLTGQCWYYTSA